MLKIVAKKEFLLKLKGLLNDFEVIGPNDLPNKGIFYQEISDTADLCLGGGFAVEPIKKFFLEPSSLIFSCLKDNSPDIDNARKSERKRIIIGSRPCEARGLELLDKVFDLSAHGSTSSLSLEPSRAESRGSGSTLSKVERVDGQCKDNFYVNNRNRTIIIGLACDEPDRHCFCTSMGGSPVETRGMDALLFAAGEEYVIEVITERAKDIFGSIGKELDEEAKKSLKNDKEKRVNALQKKISPPESMDGIFNSDYWTDVSRSCLSCGVCTFLCPTCHCFDLIDEERKRLRCYDGCAFPDFTLEASGVNPRPTKKERYRQRVFHKFDYFKKNFGENLCVGCGRCIRHCPVKIDISSIIDKAPC
ncbi:MAG: 4Fe-4S dicluster domain-containing protein [Candidatus Wildermuthbacteria bacterium]|nr:4Fe-4S dicluster domain-containing protein [Candidatus Wildermuthbacteria bacterium]